MEMPTEVSSALETTTARPASATIRIAERMPPSGWALITSRSAAPARATASGSLAFRTLSSAAIRTSSPSSFDLNSDSSATVVHGCSTYSNP